MTTPELQIILQQLHNVVSANTVCVVVFTKLPLLLSCVKRRVRLFWAEHFDGKIKIGQL